MGKIGKNLIYNILYQLLVILLPLITAPYVARTLGAEGIGVYSYTHSVAQYFILVAMLGISNHGNRTIAATRDDKAQLEKSFWSIYLIQAFTFSVAIILYILYLALFNVDNLFITLLQLIYVVSGIFDISWYFFGTEQFKITVGRNTIIKLATVVCMFIFIHNPNDLWKYTLIMSSGFLFSQLYLWKYLFKQIQFTKVNVYDALPHIKSIIILFIPVLAYSVYKIMDKIMLGNMSDYFEVGYYENAMKVINIPLGVITAFGTVMLPRMSNMVSNGQQKESLDMIRLSVKVVSFVAAAICFGLMGVSRIFVPVFYGPGYEKCIDLINYLAISVLFIAWANIIRTQYLIPMHKDKIYITSTICGAIVNFLINYSLIPQMGGRGAAIGTIAAEFIVWFMQVVGVRRELPVIKILKNSIPYVLFGGLMAILVDYIGKIRSETVSNLLFLIVVGAFAYCLLVMVYLLVSKDEIWLGLKKFISKKINR